MAEKKDAPATPPETPPATPPAAPPADNVDESKLRVLVEGIVAKLMGSDGDKTGDKKDNPADVAAQVRAELANVRKGESAEAERRAILDRLTKLEKSDKPEDAPVLFRRIEKLMGWRLPDE